MAKRNNLNLIFTVILLGGLLLRLHELGKYSFWFDEALTLLLNPVLLWRGFINFSIMGTQISLFPFLVHLWKCLGSNEFILRLLPAIFGVLSIVVIYLLAKTLFNKKIALLSAFIVAISPFHIYYSQELRYHTLIVFLTLSCVYFYIKSLKENRPIFWLVFVSFMILNIYTHIITIFLLISLNAYYLLFFNKYKRLLFRWVAAQIFILLFFFPSIIMIFREMSEPNSFNTIAFIPKPSLLTPFYSLRIFSIGYGAPLFVSFFTTLVCLCLFLVGFSYVAKEREKTSLLLAWLLIPVILSYIISLVIKPIYLHRTLIYVTPAYYIILACGFARIKEKLAWFLILLFTLLSFISLRNQFDNVLPLEYANYPLSNFQPGVFSRIENRKAAKYIEDNFEEGDIIAHNAYYTLPPFIYYHSGRYKERCISEIDGYSPRFYYPASRFPPLKLYDFADINYFARGRKRLWFVMYLFGRSRPMRQQGSSETEKWLNKNCDLIDTKFFRGIVISLYKIKFHNYNWLE